MGLAWVRRSQFSRAQEEDQDGIKQTHWQLRVQRRPPRLKRRGFTAHKRYQFGLRKFGQCARPLLKGERAPPGNSAG